MLNNSYLFKKKKIIQFKKKNKAGKSYAKLPADGP